MRAVWLLLLLILTTASTRANDAPAVEPDAMTGMQWREVGPYRGGRAAAITGVPGDRSLYYFGATGGGVYKTLDGGTRFVNISDGFFGGSIGAVAVAPSDPNVIYVGTGEGTIRGNMSQGEGVYRSVDAGRTWKFSGLADSRTIPRIVIDPADPDTAYAAVLGDVFAASSARGVYKTSDGGATWRRVLYVNERAGADDLVIDPSNPRILYATTWRVQRGPYSLTSGGAGSGIWKSSDRGESWSELTANKGLPKATLEQPIGISSIAVSASRPDNLYALVEHAEGGLFRSIDAGKTWALVNSERALRQRAWYFSRVVADPKDAEAVWVLNVRLHRSGDGGKSFVQVRTPHVDHHDQWIDPADPTRIASANDGGATISTDGGASWTSQDNQPTAQLYRVALDNAFPYRLLAGQQDNSAIRIRSRSLSSGSIGARDWEPTAGGESGWISAKPDQPDLVFGGSYMGFLMRYDHATDAQQIVNVWPEETMGHAAADARHRFQWNFPLLHSRHNPKRLYAAANRLFKSDDDGHSWQPISPDLSRAVATTLAPSGGPITKDNTGVEYYATIFALAEAAKDPQQIWAGSDDGRVHLTLNGGANWREVTPKAAPSDMLWNAIEASPFDDQQAYLVGTRYKFGDRAPYLYRTRDRGLSWQPITRGINPTHFSRALRADPTRRGLLYAGTERGLYLSEDDGANWRAFQLNLPVVPITDLAIRDGDLIASTQGRGFWILDDLTPLASSEPKADLRLYPPRVSHRVNAQADEKPSMAGTNPPPGTILYFRLPREAKPADKLSLDISTPEGVSIITYTRRPEPAETKDESKKFGQDLRLLPSAKGLNRFAWDGRYAQPKQFDGLVLWNRNLAGVRAVPGRYRVRLRFDGTDLTEEFEIKPDPRGAPSTNDFLAQRDLALAVSAKLDQVHALIERLTRLGAALTPLKERLKANQALSERLTALETKRTQTLEAVYQTKLKSEQDPLNFPVRLNDKLAGLLRHIEFGDTRPTAAQAELAAELLAKADAALKDGESLTGTDLTAFNASLREAQVDMLDLSDASKP